ncbi:MAG: four helix bundle protein [Saprospiraceae bacterium]|nr:four helix bundle protein [Saprospiraceae bacterium]
MKNSEPDFRSLKVYQLAYELAMEIFEITKTFPKEETYSLVDQIRRSSRSVCGNIAEGYRKRQYPNHFRSKMSDADGECSETSVWVDFARDCLYILPEQHSRLLAGYAEVGKMLGSMILHPEKFLPK